MGDDDMIPGSSWWLVVRRNQRFFILVVGIIFFFGCHNYLQEYIMRLPGFRVGVFLGYLEVLGVTICAAIERHVSGEEQRYRRGVHIQPSVCV